MGPTSPPFDPQHPLLMDRERFDRILDVMFARIQKQLFAWATGRARRPTTVQPDRGGEEPVLEGTGVSAEDVLAEAAQALLQFPPDRLEGTWEGLAVRIARNKTIDALRTSGKGLRGTEQRSPLRLVSGDANRRGPDGEEEPSLFESLRSNWGDPEAEFFVLQDVRKLVELARETLNDRDREVFFAVHFQGDSRREVGKRLGLTSQRIGQIYSKALRALESHTDYPFKPVARVESSATRRNR